jgi:hypothetical protein
MDWDAEAAREKLFLFRKYNWHDKKIKIIVSFDIDCIHCINPLLLLYLSNLHRDHFYGGGALFSAR